MELHASLPPPATEALFRAARDQATGWLTLSAHGAESRLYLQAGDVVGARLGFGYQTLAQALFASGILDAGALDVLWSRGALAPGSAELLEASGGDPGRASELQMLASVRRLATLTAEASFMPALVDVVMPRVAGARVVRAAFEALGPLPPDAIVCCRDAPACAGWLLREEEGAFLLEFRGFRPAGELLLQEAALLRLLQHDGLVEILDTEGWQARAVAEREAEVRRADEEARRLAARAAIESARLAEEARRNSQRERAEQARRALEAARAAEAAWRDAQAHGVRETPIEEALADTVVRGRPTTVEETDPALLRSIEATDPAFPQPGIEAAAEAAAERGADVPRLTAPRSLDASVLPEPDTLRPVVVPGAQRDTLKSFPVAADQPPPPVRHDTEEAFALDEAAALGHGTGRRRDTLKPLPPTDEPLGPPERPPGATPVPFVFPAEGGESRKRDTLKPFPAPGEPDGTERPPGATPVPFVFPAEGPGGGRRDTLKPFPAPEASQAPVDQPPPSTPVWGSEHDDRAAADTLLRAAERVEVLPVPAPGDVEPILLGPEAEIEPGKSADELVAEMTEALRRSGAATSTEAWLAATEGVVSGSASPRAPAVPAGTEAPRPPLQLGPVTGPGDNLWRLVEPPPAAAPGPASSFEEALANVDAHLSSLVGLQEAPTQPAARADVPVDAILQASADAGAWQMESLPPVTVVAPPPAPLETTPVVTPSGSGSGEVGSAARERRQRLLRRAIQNLGSLVSRGPRTMGTATPLEPTPAPITAPLRTPQEERLARQIEERFAGLAGERNRFDVLGLPLEATREEVKTAFLDLAKVFHPDRLPPSLVTLLPQATAVFDSLREAHDHLLDDDRRAAHAEELTALASGRPLRDQAEAAEAFRAGEAALRRREHAAAEAHFAESYRLYPRAHVLAARAWALYMDPNRKADAGAARAMMVEALQQDPACDRAHYQLGVIARVEGDVDRAERHFREALRANPRHVEATQELRLIEMRKRSGPTRKPR